MGILVITPSTFPLYRITIEKSITILLIFDFFMKVLLYINSFIAAYFCEPAIFLLKKCRIQNQILHFITNKYKFNKLF